VLYGGLDNCLISDSPLLTAITQMYVQSEKQAKAWHRRLLGPVPVAVGLFLLGAYPSTMGTRILFVPAVIALFVAAFAVGRRWHTKKSRRSVKR